MAKKATAKSYKLPSNKGREKRIKQCSCTKIDGKPVCVNFTAEPFKGEACEKCLEVVSFELVNNGESKIDEKGAGNEGATPDNDDVRPFSSTSSDTSLRISNTESPFI